MDTTIVDILEEKKPERKTRILMADDHPLFRKAVRDILEKQDDFEVIAEANDGQEAVEKSLELVPDVVIMDISMPRLNGLEATRQIKGKCSHIAVLVLTIHNDIEHILSILVAGAAGYLIKSVSEDEVIAAIRSVVAGETVIATPVFQHVLKHAIRYPIKTFELKSQDLFTARELEVFRLVARGLSNKDISLRLNLSLRTVKGYLVEIFSKLSVSSRTEAVIVGLRSGF